jgi:hypothetical protein
MSNKRSGMCDNTMMVITMSGFFLFLICLAFANSERKITVNWNETQIEAVARGYAKFDTCGKTVKFIWNEPESK